MDAARARSRQTHSSDTNFKIASDPQLASLLIKANEGLGALSPEDRIRFGASIAGILDLWDDIVTQHSKGYATEREIAGVKVVVRRTFRSAGAQEWWQQTQDQFSVAPKTLIDETLE